jgi:hypothetical protein
VGPGRLLRDPQGAAAGARAGRFRRLDHGRKSFQSDTRADLPRFELDASDTAGRLKINPLIDWDSAALADAFANTACPRTRWWRRATLDRLLALHQQGRRRRRPRSGRWRGWDKTECGIHVARARMICRRGLNRRFRVWMPPAGKGHRPCNPMPVCVVPGPRPAQGLPRRRL